MFMSVRVCVYHVHSCSIDWSVHSIAVLHQFFQRLNGGISTLALYIFFFFWGEHMLIDLYNMIIYDLIAGNHYV